MLFASNALTWVTLHTVTSGKFMILCFSENFTQFTAAEIHCRIESFQIVLLQLLSMKLSLDSALYQTAMCVSGGEGVCGKHLRFVVVCLSVCTYMSSVVRSSWDPGPYSCEWYTCMQYI